MLGNSVRARSIRGSLITLGSVGSANILRLASNLILTRLLMPEAFGLMALVYVFIVGLELFSDTGVRTAIIRHERGDEPAFLNTAWTIQILRGFILCGLCWLIASPMATLYDEPLLAMLLPVVGLNPLIMGFTTTKVASAHRHLNLGRVTTIELSCQAVGVGVTVALAYMLQSVWALAIGAVLNTGLRVCVEHLVLSGIRNRLYWDQSVFGELFTFGKFIFLSTAMTFAISQGDKAILSAYVSFEELGVYNIGFFLATVPLLFGEALSSKVIMPLYRMKPIHESIENRRQIFRARRIVAFSGICLCAVLSISGIKMIDVLYPDAYALAGPIVVLITLSLVPQIVPIGYSGLLLVIGDSKNFFILVVAIAVIQTSLFFAGVIWLGMFGLILATGVTNLITYPLHAYLTHRHHGWDGWGDLALFAFGATATGLGCWWHWESVRMLIS